MTKQVQLRRGTSAEHALFTGAVGELTIDTTLDVAVVHDGTTLGGHYLVGTGFGATVSQALVNKSFIGIGTTSISGFDVQFYTIGNAVIEGNVEAKSLSIYYDPSVESSGTINDLDPTNITGISTNKIRLGYFIQNNYVSTGTTVTSIGIGSIGISTAHTAVGSISTTFVFLDPRAGRSDLYYLQAYQSILDEVGITTGYVQDLYVNSGIITTAGISSARVDNFFATSGIVTTAGISSAWINDLYVNSGIITTAGISSARVDNLYVNSGIITTANINAGIITTANIVTEYVNTANINAGIITTANITTSNINTANINTGILTTANINTANINTGIITGLIATTILTPNAYITSGIITNLYTTTLSVNTNYVSVGFVTNLYAVSGVVTNLYSTTSSINQAYINAGILTTAGISSATINNLYANSGIVTNLTAQVSYFQNTNTNFGITTNLYVENAFVNSGYVTSIVIQNASITTSYAGNSFVNSGVSTFLNVTGISTINTLNVNVGVITSASITTEYVNTANINTGILTTAGISSARVGNLYVNSGIVTTLTVQQSYFNELNANTGVVTTAHISTSYINAQYVNSGFATSFDIDTAYITSGIVTDLNATTLLANTAYINVGIGTTLSTTGLGVSNVYLNVGFATDFVVSELTATENLQANTGIITNLTGTNLSYSGVSTLGNVLIGSGTTELIVTGDARITGVLSVGSATISISGENSSISGLSSVTANSATLTNLVGTNLNYSGITTLNNVGLTTLSLVGINTLTSQDKTVTFETSKSGLATNYTLTLPPTKGTPGQLLALLSDGTLGFTTNGAGLFESRYYVSSQNGDDAYDGRALPVKTIKRAAQLASFDSFKIPGQRYLDAGDLLESNKEFIKEEVVAYLEFNYENITTALPDYDPVICKRDIGYIVESITYDVRFGGNVKSREAGLAYWNGAISYVAGEEEQAIFAYEYIRFLAQYIINNQSPPTLYQTSVNQTFDLTITQDPENNNTNYFHRSKDARNLIVGNRQEIIDKSLASVALAATTGFYFPGETETNERSRYYDSYKLIQINKQEIVDKSIASIAIGFPTGFYVPGAGIGSTTKDSRYYDAYRLIQINKSEIVATAMTAINLQYPTLWSSGVSSAKCQRDLGYFVDAVSTDVFTGGNNYAREFTGFYFVGVGTTSLAGEEQQTIYGFQQAGIQMRNAITNQLTNKNLGISSGPTTYTGTKVGAVGVTSTTACTDVQNNITTLVGIVTAAIGAATTSSLPALNLGNFNLNVIGFGTTAGIWKCARDTGFFVDAVSTDVFTGGNNYSRSFTGFYFDSLGNPLSNGLVGETSQSNYVFHSARDYMNLAVTNQLNGRDLTITADPATGFNTSPSSCSNVRSTITSLTGIVTTSVAAGSTAGIGTTTNYGYFLVNSTYNVSDYVGIGTTNVVGGRKCARDLGYIVNAIAEDINYGSNQHIIYATKKYFNGAGTARTDGLLGEEVISAYAFRSVGTYAKRAVTNWLNYQDLTILNDVSVGSTNKNPNVCSNIRSNIDSLVGILTTAVLSGSLVGIASTSLGGTDCADVRSAIVNYVGIITTIVGLGTTAAPEEVRPQTQSKPICIVVEAGEYLEDNPIILYDDIAVVGDNLRNTIVRPLNAGKDLFRVRNGVYLNGFAMKDKIDVAGVPQYTFDYAVAFDDPTDTLTSRSGYATKLDPPIISRSPYIQNCSILSFLGANGILVDGSKVQTPNTPLIAQEAEIPLVGDQPEQGKSMVAATFTMVSFGGVGWRTINDGYAQVVSCFQIFCRYGSLTQSGGYLSITNSATNFGLYALRSTGFSPNSFRFDRGRIAATGTSGGLSTLKVVGLGRSDQDLYVLRFFNNNNVDQSANFKTVPTIEEFVGAAVTNSGVVNLSNDTFNIAGHPFSNGDSVIYYGDEGVIPSRVIGGLVNQNQYYVVYIDSSSFKLAEDETLLRIIDLTSVSTGIHTFIKNTQEFYASAVIDRHNSYQRLTLAGITTLNFVSGRTVTQTVAGGTAVGYAYTYDSSARQLVVSVELSEGVRRNFSVTSGSNLTIADHSGSPISTSITAVTGLSTYWSIETKVDSTLAGGTIQGIASLPENYKLHFHRPSIINSSSHTWEFSGSGIDYNALPQNGGKTITATEQVSEGGGRVFASGTNELGDFKIGDFITAYNRTGNIIFNNTVTIGTLDSIRLSLSGGVAIEQFSIDGGLGDNETGGPSNSRVSTQLAVRTFLSNRLGGFIDKLVSTNAVPNAIVQLNSIGQINPDLIPPKTVNYYRSLYVGGRTQLVNLIPATDLNSGDAVSEPIDSFVLISDLIGQYLVLNNSTVYNFQNGDQVVSVNSAGGAIGIVTAPTTSGINTTTLSFPNVGYGTTGLVRGVPLSLKTLVGGSGYTSAGIYTGVRLDTSSGIGTGITATITVGASGTVTNVAIQTGGFKFAVDDILTVNDANVIGGRSGGSNFTVRIASVETRLYLRLTNQQKFSGSVSLPDYISDRNAIGYSTNIGIGTTFSFDPTSIDVGGDVDFVNDRIVLGVGHTLQDGDPVIYTVTAGSVISPLISGSTYYTKRVGVSSVELYTTYALTTKKDLASSGTGTHKLSRIGINSNTDQIVFVNHPFSQGDPIKVTGNTPTGITTGNFYFVGSVTQNSFTLHETRAESLTSVNGLLLNAIDLSGDPVGIMTLTKQNITYSDTVNTSSNDTANFSLLSTSSLDAANIVSGTITPSRLGSGSATNETFLRGDSSYEKVVMSVGIGTTQPFDVQGYSSVDFAPGGVGVNTYYGNIKLALNRVQSSIDAYSTLGIAKYKTSTFSIGSDGAVQIKSSASGGDVDAATLGGNSGTYYLDVTNHQGSIPISRGGTGLSALPSNGALLLGNGTAYTLTTTPTLQGLLTTQSIAVAANHDISFTTGTWTGEKAGKIQYSSNSLYLQFTTELLGRNSSGTNVFTLGNTGNATFNGTLTSTTLTLNGSGSTTSAQLTINGATNNWINFGTNGIAAPAFTTRSVGTKIVLYDGISGSSGDHAFGVDTFTLWSSVPTTSQSFKWYGGTTLAATLTGAGALTLVSSLSATTLTSTIATGTAPLTVTSTTTVSNLRSQYVTFGMLDNNDDYMNFRVIRNNNSVSNRDGMYIGYGNANSGNTRIYGGGDITNPVTIGSGGSITASGAISGTTLTSTIATGTAPLTVTSTTLVSNLNADLLDGLNTSSNDTSGNSVVVRSSGAFTTGAVTATTLTLNGGGSTTSAQLTFSGATNNWITFGTTGVAAPAFTTRSAGTKIVLYSQIDGTNADYAFGIESGTLWRSVPTTSQSHKWYGGTTLAATLTGAGAFTAVGAISGTTLTSTVATGTAPLTVTSTTQVSNLNASFLQGYQTATGNTINSIVLRDGSGNFTAGAISATTFNIAADTNNRFQQGTVVLRNASPTIYLRDTDHNVSMIHCNSNIFYVLRGATDSETWTQVNSVWPLQIDLTNNNATFGGTVTASSDVRFKKNIETIQDALEKVLNMRGVTFERLETSGTEIGVIAQEVEEVVPEVVTTDANGHKSVAYANLTALLIEAVKAQQVQIDELREEINKLKGE